MNEWMLITMAAPSYSLPISRYRAWYSTYIIYHTGYYLLPIFRLESLMQIGLLGHPWLQSQEIIELESSPQNINPRGHVLSSMP